MSFATFTWLLSWLVGLFVIGLAAVAALYLLGGLIISLIKVLRDDVNNKHKGGE